MLSKFHILALILPITILMAGCGETINNKTDAEMRLKRDSITMEKLTYPISRTVGQTDDYHGTAVADPYRWLEDVDSDDTHAWVKAQNEVTFDFLNKIPQRGAYKKRLTEIWNYTRYGTPFKKGARTFYFKNDGLQNQAVLYVQDSDQSEARILMDPNTLSEDGTVALGELSISNDGRWLAWSTSVSGSDWRTWSIRDIKTGADLDDKVQWSKFSQAAWDHDGQGFFYSRYDAPQAGETFESVNYYQKLYYHTRGTDQSQDRLVYEREDQKEWGFQGDVSEDGRYLIVSVWQGTSRNNRLYYLDLQDSTAEMVTLLDDYDASYNFLHNEDNIFYFRTNLEAPRERIVAIDINSPARGLWQTIIAENEDPIDGVSVLNNSFIVTYMHDVASVVKVFGFDGAFKEDIHLPGLGSCGGFAGKSDDSETYYSFDSYLSPGKIYHYNVKTGQSTVYRQPEIDFDFSAYETQRVFYTSKDGTRVPLFLVHKKGLVLDGNNPTILYGYGGFNISLTPRFSISTLPWIEQGGVYAVANLRGGGEYGEDWHQGGMLKNKQNVFDDFIAAAEFLIGEGYTSANKLALFGGSNGGTLVGAVVNQRPELFAAAIPAVGVMDMLRFHLFTIGWAWTSDYGSSEDEEMFPVLYGYSPYHNLKEGAEFPSIMVTTADHDDRVVPGHSFKYAARLQACQGGNLPVLIRIQTKAGHGAGKPTSMVIEEVADRYAFLHKTLGM